MNIEEAMMKAAEAAYREIQQGVTREDITLIIHYYTWFGEKGISFTIPELALELNISTTTARKWVRYWLKRDWVKVGKGGKRGTSQATEYYFEVDTLSREDDEFEY